MLINYVQKKIYRRASLPKTKVAAPGGIHLDPDSLQTFEKKPAPDPTFIKTLIQINIWILYYVIQIKSNSTPQPC